MNNKRPKVTYIIDGKEETKTINMVNKRLLRKKLFSKFYIFPMFKSIKIELKPEIEYIKLENFDFNKDVDFITESYKSIVVLENCNFLSYLSLKRGIFEIINPTLTKYPPLTNNKISSRGTENIKVTFNKDKNQDLPIDFEIESKKFSLINAKKVGNFHTDSNNVTIINSDAEDLSNLIIHSQNITIKESNMISQVRIYINSKELTINNASIKGINNTSIQLNVNTLKGSNYSLSSDSFIEMSSHCKTESDVYRVKSGDKDVEITDKDLIQKDLEKLTEEELIEESKLPIIRNLISNLKAIKNNAQNQIQDLKDNKSNEYIEEINYHNNEINYHNNEINNHKEQIKKLEEKSVADSKKLERKLKHQSINTYYNRK